MEPKRKQKLNPDRPAGVTKARILAEALRLFSVQGYDPVSVRDIARAVGIKESSLYNHFASKQAIFDSILAEYGERWRGFFHSAQVPGESDGFQVDDTVVGSYVAMSDDQFAAMAAAIFDHYFLDEIHVQLRRLLTIEQYRNPELAQLFREVSFEAALNFQSRLFAALIAAGCFVRSDPEMMALSFFAPIFLIFYRFDHEPESLEQAKALFLRHIRHFGETYGLPARMPDNPEERTCAP